VSAKEGGEEYLEVGQVDFLYHQDTKGEARVPANNEELERCSCGGKELHDSD